MNYRLFLELRAIGPSYTAELTTDFIAISVFYFELKFACENTGLLNIKFIVFLHYSH